MASVANSRYAAQQAGANAGPQSYQQAQQFQQQMQQQAGMQTQALSAQSDMQNAQQQATAQLANQRTQNELYQQQQSDQWMQSQQWTTQDESQLAQVQNGWSQVQADPSLTNEEKQAAQQQYQPYLQQQQQRKQYWQTKMQAQQQQLQAEQATHLHAQTTAMDMQSAAARAGNMQKMMSVQPVRDDGGELMGHYVGAPTGDGKWNWHFAAVPKEAKDTSGQASAKAYDTEVKHRDLDEKRYTDAYVKAEGIVNGMRKETIKDESGNVRPKYPNLESTEKADWNGQPLTPYEANVMDHLTKMGFPPKKEDYLAQKAQERAAMRGETPKARTEEKVDQTDQAGKVGPMAKNGETPTASTTAPVARTEQPPFSFYAGDKTKLQEQTVKDFQGMHQDITSSNLWNTDRKAYDNAKLYVGTAQKLLERFGSEAGMPAKEKKLYDDSIDLFQKTVAPAIRRQQELQKQINRQNVPTVAPFAS